MCPPGGPPVTGGKFRRPRDGGRGGNGKGRGRGRGKGGKSAAALAHVQQSLDRIATALAPPPPAPAPSSPADAMRQLSDDLSQMSAGTFGMQYVHLSAAYSMAMLDELNKAPELPKLEPGCVERIHKSRHQPDHTALHRVEPLCLQRCRGCSEY